LVGALFNNAVSAAEVI